MSLFPSVVVQKKSDFIFAQGLHDGSVVRAFSAIARVIAGLLFRLCITFFIKLKGWFRMLSVRFPPVVSTPSVSLLPAFIALRCSVHV
jgi:hypothetical protein